MKMRPKYAFIVYQTKRKPAGYYEFSLNYVVIMLSSS